MLIDLRSDTVTKPTPAMLEAMFSAQVGDDVFGDDPTIHALEQRAAQRFGVEAALFCASGTMTNQIAIKVHTQPADEVICDALSHVYLYEGGGMMANAQVSVSLVHGNRGRIRHDDVLNHLRPTHDLHAPRTRLVVLENTMNKGGGCYYEMAEMRKIKNICQELNLQLHLDGARLFNALVETNDLPQAYGQVFDSISICLSKGLGCPVGSLLLGSKAFVAEARRVRKRWGGGWRQAGYLAAAGLYALENHVDRLKEDHARARAIGQILEKRPEVEAIYPIETNIVIFQLPTSILATDYVQQLAQKDILAVTFGKHLVRFVTHLDFTDQHLEAFEQRLRV